MNDTNDDDDNTYTYYYNALSQTYYSSYYIIITMDGINFNGGPRMNAVKSSTSIGQILYSECLAYLFIIHFKTYNLTSNVRDTLCIYITIYCSVYSIQVIDRERDIYRSRFKRQNFRTDGTITAAGTKLSQSTIWTDFCNGFRKTLTLLAVQMSFRLLFHEK